MATNDLHKYNTNKKIGFIPNRLNKKLKIDIYDYDAFKPKIFKDGDKEILIPQVKIIYGYKNHIYHSWLHLGTEILNRKYQEPIYPYDRFIITNDNRIFCLEDMVEIADSL